jgi:hypothetical protein
MLSCIQHESFRAGAQSERDKHRWIPITERLPEPDVNVLALFEYRGEKMQWICYYSPRTGVWHVCFPHEAVVKVSSWQPLPEA